MKVFQEKAPAKDRPTVDSMIELLKVAKQDASYWLGLVAFERRNFPAAADYLKTRTLTASPDGPWTAGARYNLGRVYEAQGKIDEAILMYQADRSAQRTGNLLRARRLEKAAKAGAAAKDAAG